MNAECSWETLDDVGDLEHLPIDDFIDSDRRFCWKDSIKILELLTKFWIPLRVVDSVQMHARIQVSNLKLSHRNRRHFHCDCLALRFFCKSEPFHPCTHESWHVRHPPHTPTIMAGLLHRVAEQQRLKTEAKAETAKVETTGMEGCRAVYGGFDCVNVIDRLQLLCCDQTHFR